MVIPIIITIPCDLLRICAIGTPNDVYTNLLSMN